MDWYKHKISEYQKDASRLSLVQRGVFVILTDWCYANEAHPTKKQAHQAVLDSLDGSISLSDDEIQAVDSVLESRFLKHGHRYYREDIDADIERRRKTAEANKKNAAIRLAKREAKKQAELDRQASESFVMNHEDCSFFINHDVVTQKK